MRKMTSRLHTAALLVASLSVASPALAVSFEDSLDDCSYPKTFDVLVLRPMSSYALLIGSTIFVLSAPFAAMTVRSDFSQYRDGLVGSPYRFTFKRPLGECAGVQLAY